MKRYVVRKNLGWFFLFFLLTLFLYGFMSCADNSNNKESSNNSILNWLPYDQALAKSKIENIPTLIYFYSDQCGWCKKLENETFNDQKVWDLMSQKFSIVKINSNSTRFVIENGKKMTEKQLSEQIYQVKGNPTVWFLADDHKRIASLPGYVKSDVFVNVLNYIKDGYYKNITFQKYMEIEQNKP